MDRFAWGAVVVALVVEGFIVWGWTESPQDVGDLGRLGVASAFPLVLVLVTVLLWFLQRP